MIFFENKTINPRIELVYEALLPPWLINVAEYYGKSIGELNYLFVDGDEILSINKQYLQHEYVTDVITFNNSSSDSVSADVFICLSQVQEQSNALKIRYEEEFLRIIVHALLHLLGEDDTTFVKSKKMRQAEDKMLELFYSNFA